MSGLGKALYISSSPGEDRFLGMENGRAKDYFLKRFDMGPMRHEMYMAKIEQWSPGLNGFFLTLGDFGKAFLPVTSSMTVSFKPGDLIPITVTRGIIDDKSVRVTTDIVLPGPRLLFIPSKPGVHLSHRAKQKSGQAGQLVLHKLKTEGINHVLIKETALSSDFTALLREGQFLTQTWKALSEEIRLQKKPSKLRFGSCFSDWITADYLFNGEVFIGNERLFNEYRIRWSHMAPDLKDNIKLMDVGQIDTIIQENLDGIIAKRVPFGRVGELVIEETEALTSIDVNAFAGNQKTNATHHLNINLSAIPEIIRQIRLRNLAGLIMIDFINMRDDAMNKAIEAEMTKMCASDHAEVDILPISKFGIMQMSRERNGHSIQKLYFDSSENNYLSFKSITLNLLRALSHSYIHNPEKKIQVFARREFLEKMRASNNIIELLPEPMLKNIDWIPDNTVDFFTPYYTIAGHDQPVFI